MSRHEEDEIQQKIEAGQSLDITSDDALAYSFLFKSLSKEPKQIIKDSLAHTVVERIVARRKREARRDFVWLSFGVIFLFLGLLVTASVAGLTLRLGFLKEISAYTGIFIFGAMLIIAFQWMERKIISKTRIHEGKHHQTF